MSLVLHGVAVSGNIAIGRAHIISSLAPLVEHQTIALDQVPAERERFSTAVSAVRAEFEQMRQTLVTQPSPSQEIDDLLGVSIQILADPTIAGETLSFIERRRCNAEWALAQQIDQLVQRFDEMEDAYLRERKHDVLQVAERILKVLAGHPSPWESARHKMSVDEGQMILIAHDLSPADMLLFKNHHFAGFATDLGGPVSHTAILARGLGLPAVVALRHAHDLLREDDFLILDGEDGVLILDPDRRTLDFYEERRAQMRLHQQKLWEIRLLPTRSADNIPVSLQANIDLPDEMAQTMMVVAQGVGLLRSEFLFMNRPELPNEEEQYQAYRQVIEASGGHPVTIRTLDVGADKLPRMKVMANPSAHSALGLRGIRFCLTEPQLFNVQLRAILRSAYHGPVRILLPMIGDMSQIKQARACIAEAQMQLATVGIPHAREVPVGAMIEIPAAAISLPLLAPALDFVSIGTNDLIQYTLAIDRTDDAVSGLYDPLHPAVLYIIANVVRVAHSLGIEVAMCGEMAGEPRFTRLLLGLGLRVFSMHPTQLLLVKERILNTNIAAIEAKAQEILSVRDVQEIPVLLAELNRTT